MNRSLGKLKKGDYFGAGRDGGLDLICRHDGFVDGRVQARVLNGGWRLSFDPVAGVGCPFRATYKVVFADPIPESVLDQLSGSDFVADSVLLLDHMQAAIDRSKQQLSTLPPIDEAMPVTRERTQQAIESAGLAFWAEIAAAFPECRTGEFGVDATARFAAACESAVNVWLDSNHPSLQPEGDCPSP
jgi:hypothetical protein